tara:strand:- start:217 stop:672 length:456 start_codon:yes stop_codon:yes gene_type:complete
MRIPTKNLSNEFISEILNLFKINSKDINNQIVLVEESFLYNIFYNIESKSIELTSFISVQELTENQKDNLNFVIKNHDPRIDFSFETSKEKEGESNIYIYFDYSLSKNDYLEDLEILNLHNLFNLLLYKVNHICREINIRKRINELNSIDI